MKVLHIGKFFPPHRGGMETYLRDLMEALQSLAIEPYALVHKSDYGLRSSEDFLIASKHKVTITRAAVWGQILFTPISPTFPLLLRKLIIRDHPDILHFHVPNVSAFWALLSPRARRIPWVVHWHSDVLASDHNIGLKLFYGLYRPFERALLKHANTIIVTSQPYLDSSKPLSDFTHKCLVIPLGIRPINMKLDGYEQQVSSQVDQADTYRQDSDQASISNLQVLAVGRLTYYKGFQFLIEAIAQTPGTSLVLVGQGDKFEELQDLSRRLGAQSRVVFFGNANDNELAQLMRACDCVCLPSIERTEAFGIVLLEAMSCGKPCIVSNITGSGVGWVVEDGVTGLHAAPGDPFALASCLATLRHNRDSICAFGAAGQERFNRLFRISKSAAEIARIYQDLTAGSAPDVLTDGNDTN